MTQDRSDAVSKIMQLSACIEIATGAALMLVPAIVVGLLFGPDANDAVLMVARLTGIALLALGLACWQSRWQTGGQRQAYRALLSYNALVAGYLCYLALIDHIGGVLLWPAVGIHALVAGGLLLKRKPGV